MSPRLISTSSSSVSVTDLARWPLQIAVERFDALHACVRPGRQSDDAIARTNRAGSDLSRVAAKI